MPANPQSLRAEEAYRAQLKRLWRRVVAVVESQYRSIDPDDLAASFRAFIPSAATVIEMGQAQAVTLADAFVSTYVAHELDEGLDVTPEVSPGQTVDGRRLEEALSATPAKVFLALKMGRPIGEALNFGRFSVARLAHTEVVDASREELKHQIDTADQVKGWRWSAQGSACGACLAADNGAIRPTSSTLIGHAGCDCVMEPVVAGVRETIHRPTGKERFESLNLAEQNALLGDKKAEAVRSGDVAFTDLIKTERHEEWRSSITEAPLEAIT